MMSARPILFWTNMMLRLTGIPEPPDWKTALKEYLRRNRRESDNGQKQKETTERVKRSPDFPPQIFIAPAVGALLGVVIHYWIPVQLYQRTPSS